MTKFGDDGHERRLQCQWRCVLSNAKCGLAFTSCSGARAQDPVHKKVFARTVLNAGNFFLWMAKRVIISDSCIHYILYQQLVKR